MTKVFVSNFFQNLRRFLVDHQRQLIKLALVLVGALVLAWLILYAMERFQQWGYEKGVKALDEKVLHYEAEAKAREAEAEALKNALNVKYGELAAIRERAETAERKLDNARHQSGQLKVIYEKTRDNPDIPVDISNRSACEELAMAGHPCK